MTSSFFASYLLPAAGGGWALTLGLGWALYPRRQLVAGLLVVLALLSGKLAFHYAYITDLLVSWPALIWFDHSLNYLYGPLMYGFISQCLGRPVVRWYGHLIPAGISVLLQVPFMVMDGDLQRAFLYGDRFSVAARSAFLDLPYRFLLDWVIEGAAIHMAFYLAWLGRDIWRYRQSAGAAVARRRNANGLALIWLAFFVLYALFLALARASRLETAIDGLMYGGVMLVQLWLAWWVLKLPGRMEAVATEQQQQEKADKYRSSALDTETSALFWEELETRMANDRPWLEPDLTLPGLAARLGWSANYLSQVINEQSGKNFFEYINGYRIAAARSMLKEEARVSVQQVFQDCGFNSKSAFYAAFKKATGMTPSQYRRGGQG